MAITQQSSLEESLLSGTVSGDLWWAAGMAHQCPQAARWYGARYSGPRCYCCTTLQTTRYSHAYSCL